jgi:Ca-activated chloride channel family protein
MAAAILLILSCVRAGAQEPGEVVRVDAAMVTLNVSVTDQKGRHLPGLRAEDFSVSDEGRPVRLEFFDRDGPASIVFVVDVSSSMGGLKWQGLKFGLKRFLAGASAGNDYTLVAFNDTVRLVALSVGGEELWRSFNTLKPSGETALYDGVLVGLSELGRAPQRHKALVLLSDGGDNSSRAASEAVEQAASARRATVYAVGIHRHPHDIAEEERGGHELLKRLAAATGGSAHFPGPDEIAGVLRKIETDVRGRYSLSYYPPSVAPGWRRVRVNLTQTQQTQRRLNLIYQQRYLIR